ncbi:MAG: nitrite reductase (NADH) small subunit [Mariniblastus sp.]|jgi:nitrite reductase (NADH) small subunit
MYVVNETRVGIFHVGDEFFALDDRCPHAGASLACGTMEGETVVCRIHHWHFSIRDGTYLDEARPELNAQRIPIRIVAEEIQISI